MEHPGDCRAGAATGQPRPVSPAAPSELLAVVLEGAALPLVHSAWATAAGFTVLNAALLARRIQVEERALATVAGRAAALR